MSEESTDNKEVKSKFEKVKQENEILFRQIGETAMRVMREKMLKYRSKPRKLIKIRSGINLTSIHGFFSKEEILDAHKEYGKPFSFSVLLDAYESTLNRKLKKDEKNNLSDYVRELRDEGKLAFKDGKTEYKQC